MDEYTCPLILNFSFSSPAGYVCYLSHCRFDFSLKHFFPTFYKKFPFFVSFWNRFYIQKMNLTILLGKFCLETKSTSILGKPFKFFLSLTTLNIFQSLTKIFPFQHPLNCTCSRVRLPWFEFTSMGCTTLVN